MNMKFLRQVLIVLLCCLLVQFTARAESYGASGQSSDQAPAPPVKQPPQQLQQLVAPIALYPDGFGGANSGRFHVSNADCRGGALDAESFQPQG